MKKLLFVAIAFAGLALVSCNKDQAAVKKLDGSWTATSAAQVTGGVTVDLITAGFSFKSTFNSCKLKKDEWCTGTSTTTFAGVDNIDNQVFRVTGDGTVFEWKEHKDSTTVTSMTIDELDKSTLVTTYVDGTTSTTLTYSKD
jgi:hypothetical protein